jgi:predicted metal-binding protein
MAELREFDRVLVFQTVSDLEDSYDFEGMMEAGARQNKMMMILRDRMEGEPIPRLLHLGAGGCQVCEVCAKKTNEPCRHPDKAVSSLETYGINVSALAKTAGMKYINGQNTVTYFGAMLFDL